MSTYAVYKQLVRGSSLDPLECDLFHRRPYARSFSAYPESSYLECDHNPIVARALSSARELILEPTPNVKSYDLVDHYDTRDTLARLRNTLTRSDDYFNDRLASGLSSPKRRVYVSSQGREYPIYSPRRSFPTNYWSYYPYSCTLPPFYNYGSRHWSLSDSLSGGGLRRTPYVSASSLPNYRPTYIHSQKLRHSYLYPQYI